MLTSKLCAMDGARKMQRKNERRRKKCEHIVAKETGAVCSDVATKVRERLESDVTGTFATATIAPRRRSKCDMRQMAVYLE